ncbi:MAG: hypothetical protein PHS07_02510 [Patescibacteria group bacterium]|nr:hypothetical protein [Patescibacteria group bacterium]
MSIYRPIFKQSWQIIKKYKFLWWFGILITLLSSTANELTIIINNLGNLINGNLPMMFYNLYHLRFLNMPGSFLALLWQMPTINLIFYLGGLGLITVFLIWLGIIARAAVINFVLNQPNQTNFKNQFQQGKQNFWPLFKFTLSARLIAYGFLLIILSPLILFKNIHNFWIYLSFAIFILVSIFLMFILRYGSIYVIKKHSNVLENLKNSFKLFKNNFVISLEMIILIALITLLMGIISIVITIIALIPLILIFYIFTSLNLVWGINVILTLIIVSVIFLFLLSSAIIQLYQQTAWVLLFEKLVSQSINSKIKRLISRS